MQEKKNPLWHNSDLEQIGVWATVDKLKQGGAMEFVVEKISAADGKESFKIVDDTWQELPSGGLQSEEWSKAAFSSSRS